MQGSDDDESLIREHSKENGKSGMERVSVKGGLLLKIFSYYPS